jgi:tetratricopeptide (TPR) repeat protein
MKKRLLFIACALLLAGCGPQSGAKLDSADEKDARVRKGLERVQQKNWDAAVQQFDAALTKNPELGLPDLELAMIYHQQKKNYARAGYHYERYLEKRPHTEKRPLIQEWIQQAKVSLAGEIGGGGDVPEELVRLTRENNMLRKQLEAAGGAVPAKVSTVKTLLTEPPPPRHAPAPLPAPAEIKPAKPARTYPVRPGDTLTRIAGSVYGDTTQWRRIYEANRDKMKTETDLKVGQTLIIPDL